MHQLVETLAVGLGNGATIALIAVGFVVVYKSTNVVNFAQPALMVAGGYLTSVFAVSHGLNFLLAVVLAIAATVLIGLVIERLALRPMVGESVFAAVIVTVGVDIVVRTILNRQIGAFVRPVGDPWGLQRMELAGAGVQHRHIAMVLVAGVIFGGLMLFFQRSRLGLAMRATALDQEVAAVQGINVGMVFAMSWAIAGALAAVGGTFVGTGSGIEQGSFIIAFKALPAIILGGMDSIGGAVIGGLAVGVLEALVATYQGTQPGQCCAWLGTSFSSISGFALMLLVLLVRPYGLFGTPEVERV